MNEPYVGNRGGDKSLHGCHAEALHYAGGHERTEGRRLGRPESRDQESDRGSQIDRPLPDLDGQGVADKTGDGYGGYTGALETECELL